MGVSPDIDRTPGNSSTAEIEAASTDDIYYIYSSKAGKTPEGNVCILSQGTNTDQFVSSLKNQANILEAAPDPVATFDSSDEWSKWLTKFDGQASRALSSRLRTRGV